MTVDPHGHQGEVLWRPSESMLAGANLTRYLSWLAADRGLQFEDYDRLWAWSVEQVEGFWASLWDFFEVEASAPYESVLQTRTMPGAEWFPGARLNYAQHALRHATDERPAVVFVSEGRPPVELGWAELSRQVGALAAWLRDRGVTAGDAVVGYLPNIPQSLTAFLACASIGAVWSACSPDFGTRSVIERFRQLEPVVFVVADGYRYGGKELDRRDAINELRASLPTVRDVIWVPYLHPESDAPTELAAWAWADVTSAAAEPVFEQVPFEHPLWVLYSSGTTGPPKGIVHGHGGILLEEMKALALHLDVKAGDRFFWFTSTSWTMWNIVVSALLVGATIVLYDGSPTFPDVEALFQLASQCRLTLLGTSAAYLLGSQRAGVRPGDRFDLTSLKTLGSTGSPLPASGFRWVYANVKRDVWLVSGSGGTDVASGFVGGCPLLPVRAGEIQGRSLGARVEAWNDDGKPVLDEVGELVITEPMPSMPLYFWNDPGGERYREAYFSMFPGVWRHGDWVTVLSSGGVFVHGRSDSTINRMGVRMGSVDIYEVVEKLPEVREALVIGAEQPDGGYYMPLFVALEEGVVLDDALRKKIADAIRAGASPRHVPDEIIAVPGVPHTLTGKKLEVPIKRLLQGISMDQAVNLGAVDDPELVRYYARLGSPTTTP